MAVGWTRAAERDPDPDPPRSFAERLRSSIAGRIGGSLAAGRRWVSAGRVALEKMWNKVAGRDAPASTEPAPPVGWRRPAVVVSLGEDGGAGAGLAQRRRPDRNRTNDAPRVVEMSSYRVPCPDDGAAGAIASAAGARPAEEENVEQMQGIEAVNETQWVRPRPETADRRSSHDTGLRVDDEVDAAGDELSEAAVAVAIDAGIEVGHGVVEARESEPGDDDGTPDEGDDSDEPSAEATGEGEGEGEETLASERLDSIVESLLLAAGAPLTVRRMCDAIRSGPLAKDVRAALKRLEERYAGASGIHLVEIAGGYQLRTSPANAKYVRALLREKPARLGRAALETLSIVAYRQPVTRGEIEAIRGVDADSAINTLLSKRLIKIEGRKEAVGRPLLYATTPDFLEVFGLRDLKELPTLKEIGPVPEPEADADIDDDLDGGAETAIAAAVQDDGPAVAAAQENGAQRDEPETAVAETQDLGRNRDEEDDDFEDEDEDEELDDDDEDADGFEEEDFEEDDDDLEFEDEDDDADEDEDDDGDDDFGFDEDDDDEDDDEEEDEDEDY